MRPFLEEAIIAGVANTEDQYSSLVYSTNTDTSRHQQQKQSFGSYIPSFGGRNDSLANGPIVARKLFGAGGVSDRSHNDLNQNITHRHDKLVKQRSQEENSNFIKPGNGFSKKSTFGTHETLTNLSSKAADFSTRVLESFSDFNLESHPPHGPSLLEFPPEGCDA